MKLSRILLLLSLFMFPTSVLSADFDCVTPPFGEDISKFEGFVKYKEAGGIDYYNYCGPSACQLPGHSRVNLAIAYAAVDGKLYSQITSSQFDTSTSQSHRKLFDDHIAGRINMVETNETAKEMHEALQATKRPKVKKRSEDQYEIIWNIDEHNQRVKMKYNLATGQNSVNFYYLPIYEKLKK